MAHGPHHSSGQDPTDYRKVWRELRQSQGLPVHIQDPVVIEKIVTIRRAIRPSRPDVAPVDGEESREAMAAASSRDRR